MTTRAGKHLRHREGGAGGRTRKRRVPGGRIVTDPRVMLGKPVVRGTRITVEILLEKLAADLSVEQVLADYPRLTREDILAALEYASQAVGAEEIRPLAATSSSTETS